MCVIMIGNITWDEHNAAKRENGDGFSFYTKEQGVVKAPTHKQVVGAIGKWGIWHYRIGTSGTKDTSNIHPFPICNGQYYLYQNGVFGQGSGVLSDTHAVARTLQNVELDTAKSVVAALSQGTNSRLLIVSADNPYEFYMWGNWVADRGIILSHRLYGVSHDPRNTSYTTVPANNYNKGVKQFEYRTGKQIFEGDDD